MIVKETAVLSDEDKAIRVTYVSFDKEGNSLTKNFTGAANPSPSNGPEINVRRSRPIREPILANSIDAEPIMDQVPFNNSRPRLYKTTLINPRPAAEVERIEYASRVTRSAPFLAGLTVE